MYLKILSHPISLDFHFPMVIDLSHPVIMLEGENGSGKSTLLHAIACALRGEEVEQYAYTLKEADTIAREKVLLFDAEQHNPRTQPYIFDDDPNMKERKVFIDGEHPVVDNTVLYNWPWKMNGVDCRMQSAPLIGEHSEYVFGEILGFSREEIENLVEQEIIY